MAKNRVSINLKGRRLVMKNLNKQIGKIKFKSMKGLLLAAAHVRRDMDKTPPLIPVDTGNLRSSWIIESGRSFTSGGGYVVMGFTAKYAPDVEFNEKFEGKRPNSGPFFFTSAIERNNGEILNIIRNSAKI